MNTLTPQIALLSGGILGAFITGAIVLYVLQVIAYWKMFTKAGVPGWKSIIPFYNMYIQYKLTYKTERFWLVIGLAVVIGILNSIIASSAGTIVLILGFLTYAAAIAIAVVQIIANVKLSKSYGYGGGFAVGLIFLPVIFTLILGFGSSEYIGNTCE